MAAPGPDQELCEALTVSQTTDSGDRKFDDLRYAD